MALGIGYGLPFISQHGTNPYKTQWSSAREGAKGAGATVEDENAGVGSCLVARGQEVYTDGLPFTPSLLIVPQFYKEGNLYQDVPPFVAEDTTMRFTVTRATTATRVNSSGLIESVASGVPRIDWLGQTCPALLVEPAATNFALNVSGMRGQDTPTASGGMTITTGSTDFTAPDGTSGTINKYVGGAASGSSQYAYYTAGVTVTASGQHTFSLFVKAGVSNPLNFVFLQLGNYTGGSGTATSYFSLASGTALTAGASIQDYGNGWYRLISAPYTIASGDLAGNVFFGMAEANNNFSWPASGALNLTAYTWGAQVEAGAVATTYIPTTTGAFTRNADIIRASGAVSGSIGQTEGTIYAEVDIRNFGLPSSSGPILQINFGGSINDSVVIYNDSTKRFVGLVYVSGLIVANISTTTGLSAGIYKLAFAYKENDFVFYMNGNLIGTDTNGNVPACDRVALGEQTPNSGRLSDRIRAAALYTTRLSNDQLAELTRL
jgi:hypothetical protein